MNRYLKTVALANKGLSDAEIADQLKCRKASVSSILCAARHLGLDVMPRRRGKVPLVKPTEDHLWDMRQLVKGATIPQIAAKLGITSTAVNHRVRAYIRRGWLKREIKWRILS